MQFRVLGIVDLFNNNCNKHYIENNNKIYLYFIMSNQVCNDTAYLNSVDQKKRFQLLNIPPVRYDNLASNPYQIINPTTKMFYTKAELDMRRKAEILKYSSNRMSTQTNNLTKAQRYAQAVNGSFQQRTYSQSFILANKISNNVVNICPRGVVIQTPTTSSDVPGPPMLLYEDTTVPIYNLTNDADGPVYGILNQNENPYTQPWDYTRNISNIYVPYSNTTIEQPYNTLTNIYILNVNVPTYLYSLSTPIAMNLSGMYSTTPLSNNYTESGALQISIYSVSLNVKYSYSNVPFTVTPPVSLFNNRTISVDVNLTGGAMTFNARCYLGTLNVNNIPLPVKKGFIYDIQVSITYGIIQTTNYSNNCVVPTITTILNTSANNAVPTSNNCTINNAISPPSNFPVLSVTGTPSNY
jgi:hypothetical protein